MVESTSGARRRNLLLGFIGVAVASSLVTFAVTWALTSSRAVSVTFVNPKTASQATATPSATNDPGVPPLNPATSGQVAFTEAELRSSIKTLGGVTYWAGPMTGARYTFTHLGSGQNFVRYLPNGKGLADVQQNYRMIATYQDPKAYQTMQAAGKLATGVSITNPDGSLVYYAKATPTHVYLAYKTLAFQIEIFDPTSGTSLKLATTPGLITTIG